MKQSVKEIRAIFNEIEQDHADWVSGKNKRPEGENGSKNG